MDEHAKQSDSTERPVSELEGAMSFLASCVTDVMNAGDELIDRLGPVLGILPEPVPQPGAEIASVDPRSAHVRSITEQSFRIQDITERLRGALQRLDV